MKVRFVSSLILLALTGCATVGPKAIKQAQYPYNEAIIQSWNEQLLLNLVRLRYRDNPYFLEVGGLNTSYALGYGLGVDDEFHIHSSIKNFFQIQPKLNYEEKPTITYQPLRGESFVKQLLSPIPPQYILVLTHSGWNLERVFNICVEKINDFDNATSATGPTPDCPPNYERFDHLTSIMGCMQKAGMITLGPDPREGSDKSVVMKVDCATCHTPLVEELNQLLGFESCQELIRLSGNLLDTESNTLKIRPRSLLGTLFYLSQGVQVPVEHMERGLVTVTRNADGSLFDWNLVSGKEMKIFSSKKNPAHASTKVFYKGYWFYIDETDLNSKSSFLLLSQLFNMQSGKKSNVSPTLTIDVSGN